MPKVSVFGAIQDEHNRILLVRRNYGSKRWTTPGGGMENGESVFEALRREAAEEIRAEIDIGELVGLYSTPHIDDLVLLFYASIVKRGEWTPGKELSAIGYFATDSLPSPLHFRTRARITDALDSKIGVVRVFTEDEDQIC